MAFRDTLENFVYNFQTDPTRNKKIIFVVAWGVGLILLGAGIWALNQPAKPKDVPISTSTQSELSDSFLESFSIKFPQSVNLKPIITKSLKNDKNFIADNLGNPIFISNDGSLMAGERIISKDFPIQSPLSVFPTKEGYIVNDYLNSIFVSRDGATGTYNVVTTPEGVTQIVPLNTGIDEFGFTSKEEYYFVVKTETGYNLKKSQNIQLTESQNLGSIDSDIATSGFSQIWRSRNTLIISLFDSPAQQGKAEYWIFKNGKLTKAFDVSDNWSTLVQENYLIVTHKALYSDIVANYVNDIYDLSGDVPKLVEFAPSFEIRKLGIYGNMLARRCTITNANLIYCLIKEKPAKTDNINEPDVIVKLDTSKKAAEILSSNASIPASNSVIYDTPRKRLLFSNAIDMLVYELVIN